MTDLTDKLKQQAKKYLKVVRASNAEACSKARAVYKNLGNVPDADLGQSFTLMQAQHVVAVTHGYESWDALRKSSPIELHLAVTMEKIPELNDFGIGMYDGDRSLPEAERLQKFEENRQRLRKSLPQIEGTIAWLCANVTPTKTLNRQHSSYGMKGVVEQDIGYITNGVFIAAGILAGFKYKIDAPNVWFAMSEGSFGKVQRQREANRQPYGWMQNVSVRSPLEEPVVDLVKVIGAATLPAVDIARNVASLEKVIGAEMKLAGEMSALTAFAETIRSAQALGKTLTGMTAATESITAGTRFIREQQEIMERMNPIPKALRRQFAMMERIGKIGKPF